MYYTIQKISLINGEKYMRYDFDPEYFLDEVDYDLDDEVEDDFFDEDYDGFANELSETSGDFVYDTYDSILDNLDPDPELDTDMRNASAFPSDKELGLAFALAEEISELEKRTFDVDEMTDVQNMEKINKYTSLQNRQHKRAKKLRPFERYIEDICCGRRSIFDLDD